MKSFPFAALIFLSAKGADGFFTPRSTHFAQSTTQIHDIVSNYQRRGEFNAPKNLPDITIDTELPVPIATETLPDLVIIVTPPVVTIPEPIIEIPEPSVVESVVNNVVTKTQTDRAPTIFEFFRDNLGAFKQSAKTAGVESSTTKLLDKSVPAESFDRFANARDKLAIMKANMLTGIPALPAGDRVADNDAVNSKLNMLRDNALHLPGQFTVDEDLVKKSTDFGKALGGVAAAAGAAATTTDIGATLKTLSQQFRFEEFGGWYVAGCAILVALWQRKVGFDEAQAEFTLQLEDANKKAAEAAASASVAANAANRATKMVVNADDVPTMASLLQSSQLRAIQVDKEMMQSALQKLTVETAALKKQLAATNVPTNKPEVKKPFEEFTTEMMQEMEDPEASARILALLKQVDAENRAKKAAAEKEAREAAKAAAAKVAAEKAAEKVAAEKAAAEEEVKATATKAAAEQAEVKEKIAAEAKAAAEQAEVEEKIAAEAKAKASKDKATADKAETNAKKTQKVESEKAAKDEEEKTVAEAKAEGAARTTEKTAVTAKAKTAKRAPASKKNGNGTKKVVQEPVLEPAGMFFAADEPVSTAPKGGVKGAKKVVTPKADKGADAPKADKKSAKAPAETLINPWKALSPSTLKRKTSKDLTEYLEQRGYSGVAGDGKPLTKEELVAVVQSF